MQVVIWTHAIPPMRVAEGGFGEVGDFTSADLSVFSVSAYNVLIEI